MAEKKLKSLQYRKIKHKLGLKGKLKPGDMISKLNEIRLLI